VPVRMGFFQTRGSGDTGNALPSAVPVSRTSGFRGESMFLDAHRGVWGGRELSGGTMFILHTPAREFRYMLIHTALVMIICTSGQELELE